MVQRIFETKLYRTLQPTQEERLTSDVFIKLKFLRQNLARAAGRDNPQRITVTLDYLYDVGEKQGWLDPFTGERLEFVRGGNWGMKNAFGTGASNPLSCSIDRIDSELGYVPGNIQLVTARTNLAKGNMSNNEFIRFAKKIAAYRS